jgi:hypothetical protein
VRTRQAAAMTSHARWTRSHLVRPEHAGLAASGVMFSSQRSRIAEVNGQRRYFGVKTNCIGG